MKVLMRITPATAMKVAAKMVEAYRDASGTIGAPFLETDKKFIRYTTGSGAGQYTVWKDGYLAFEGSRASFEHGCLWGGIEEKRIFFGNQSAPAKLVDYESTIPFSPFCHWTEWREFLNLWGEAQDLGVIGSDDPMEGWSVARLDSVLETEKELEKTYRYA